MSERGESSGKESESVEELDVSAASRKRKRTERVVYVGDLPVEQSDVELDEEDRQEVQIIELESDKDRSSWEKWSLAINIENP